MNQVTQYFWKVSIRYIHIMCKILTVKFLLRNLTFGNFSCITSSLLETKGFNLIRPQRGCNLEKWKDNQCCFLCSVSMPYGIGSLCYRFEFWSEALEVVFNLVEILCVKLWTQYGQWWCQCALLILNE